MIPQELADYLHRELCGDPCGHGGTYRAGSAHHDYYQMRAQNLMDRLSPLIGAEKVLEVTSIVVGEVLT